jgi:hypothetical protein
MRSERACRRFLQRATMSDMDVEQTIEFLLGQQVRFDTQMGALNEKFAEKMAELSDKMESMVDYQIGMDERHDREIADIRSALRQAVRLSVEEQRRERVRCQALDAKVDKVATSVQAFIEAIKKDRNGH